MNPSIILKAIFFKILLNKCNIRFLKLLIALILSWESVLKVHQSIYHLKYKSEFLDIWCMLSHDKWYIMWHVCSFISHWENWILCVRIADYKNGCETKLDGSSGFFQ